MRLINLLAAALLAGQFNYSLADDDGNASEKIAILAVVDKVFAAVHSQNPDDFRALLVPGGSMLTFRPDPSNEAAKPQLRMTSGEEFVAGLQKTEHDYREYWTAEPTVLLRGPIAVVWGPFEFTIDEKFSHCGVNSIDMVKLEGEWKVVNIMWTTEREDCPTGAGTR